jgi:hypothetical protein
VVLPGIVKLEVLCTAGMIVDKMLKTVLRFHRFEKVMIIEKGVLKCIRNPCVDQQRLQAYLKCKKWDVETQHLCLISAGQ